MKNVVHTIATNSAATEDYRDLASSLFRNGFVSLADLTNPEDIRVIEEELLSLLEDLGDGKIDVRSLGDGSRAGAEARIVEIASPSALRPKLLQSLFFQRAAQISRAILGPSARLGFDHFITKPPRSAAATAWHQDCAYKRITRSARRLHWWLPLQSVTTENGCMQFVAGSHLGPVLAHEPRSKGAHALKTNLPSGANALACPLELGGATIHLPKTLHSTGPNNSENARHAWIVQIGVRGWVPKIIW
jgi:Phytanoyl-CoA dioxygenase (PhyH)